MAIPTDRSTGVVIDGLFLSTSKPTANQKGLLVNNKFFIPFAKSSGSGGTSAEYYKCASVDTSAKTWSGYKAVFDSTAGTWSFEDTVTEGLTYTSVTPIVGGIYSPDALVTVSMLYDGTVTLPGCVFYAELKDNTSELKSGQTLTIPSSATFQTIGGVQCVQLNGTDQITFTP